MSFLLVFIISLHTKYCISLTNNKILSVERSVLMRSSYVEVNFLVPARLNIHRCYDKAIYLSLNISPFDQLYLLTIVTKI